MMLAPSGPLTATTSPDCAKAKPPLELTLAITWSLPCTTRSLTDVVGAGTWSMATFGFGGVAEVASGTWFGFESAGVESADVESVDVESVDEFLAFCAKSRTCRTL